MRYLTWIITIPLGIVAIAFAVSNRGMVDVALWPFDGVLTAPVFLVVLAVAVLAFLLGGLVAWLSGARYRRAARQAQQRADRLAGDLARAEEEAAQARQRARDLRLQEQRAVPPADEPPRLGPST
ncbi:MAG: lipopolysaccharide assembly protein LapA domain-containing protein [Azospirillaceae bacterium]